MLTKRIILSWALLLLLATAAMAYQDHRGVNIDSLEAILAGPHPPRGKELMRVYLPLMRAYQVRDNDRCVYYARKALALSYEINGLNARESALYNLGLMAYGRDEWDLAIDYFQQALAVTDSMRSDRRYTPADVDDNLSQLYGAIGNVYNMQDQLLLAIEYYQRALPIFERNHWSQSLTILHHNVGELYLMIGNAEKAERHYLQALNCGTESGDSLMMALARKGLSKIYLDRGDYEQLQRTLLPAYDYYHAHREEELGDYSEILVCMARMNLQEEHRNVEAAQEYTDEALSYVGADLMSEQRGDVYAAAAEVAMARRQWPRALELALQSVHPDSVATYGDVSCYVLLAHIYAELDELDLAHAYINKVYRMMERFATEHYQSGLSQMEVLYETEKKQAAIERLQEQRRWMTWGAALGGLLLLLTALLFFLLWRSVRLSRRSALVKAKLDGELEERVRLARDLHDRLGGILTALKLIVSDNSDNSDNSDYSDNSAATLVDAAIREMRNVSHHLLPDSLCRYGLRTALRDYCRTMPRVRFAFMGEEQHVEHEEAIYCIVHELVNNAVKSSGATQIDVQLMAHRGHTTIVVADNGRGMVASGESCGDCSSQSPECEVQSEGAGLTNIRERLAAIGGSILVDSRPGQGTEIHIEIQSQA